MMSLFRAWQIVVFEMDTHPYSVPTDSVELLLLATEHRACKLRSEGRLPAEYDGWADPNALGWLAAERHAAHEPP